MLFSALLVIVGFALYVMTPAERRRVAAPARRLLDALLACHARRREAPDGFRDALQARTRFAFVAPGLVAIHAAAFLLMLFGRGAVGDPGTLIEWGANFGPRTTGGEPLRLITSLFVHPAFLPLVITSAALLQVGLLLERLTGHLALAVVYTAAGVLGGLLTVSSAPVAVTAGPSHAIFGLYGLLLASLIWSWTGRPHGAPEPAGPFDIRSGELENREPRLTIPWRAILQLCPSAATFFLYFALGGVARGDLAGFAVGFAGGLALTGDVSWRKPGVTRLAALAAASAVAAVAGTLLLSRINDVRPEIGLIVALEERTARQYDEAVADFKKGRLSARKLADVIDRAILPELQTARTRLQSVEGVPDEHRPLVGTVEEYFRLRFESWRLRAEGLRKGSMAALRKAEDPERAALVALQSASGW